MRGEKSRGGAGRAQAAPSPCTATRAPRRAQHPVLGWGRAPYSTKHNPGGVKGTGPQRTQGGCPHQQWPQHPELGRERGQELQTQVLEQPQDTARGQRTVR